MIEYKGNVYTTYDIPELVRKRVAISRLVFDLKNEEAMLKSDFKVDGLYRLPGNRAMWLVTDIQAREFNTVLILTDFTPKSGPGSGTITKPEAWLEDAKYLGQLEDLDER